MFPPAVTSGSRTPRFVLPDRGLVPRHHCLLRSAGTAEDLLAVTMLSVPVDARAALRMLETEADDLSALLSEVPVDLDLIDAEDRHIEPDSPAVSTAAED